MAELLFLSKFLTKSEMAKSLCVVENDSERVTMTKPKEDGTFAQPLAMTKSFVLRLHSRTVVSVSLKTGASNQKFSRTA